MVIQFPEPPHPFATKFGPARPFRQDGKSLLREGFRHGKLQMFQQGEKRDVG